MSLSRLFASLKKECGFWEYFEYDEKSDASKCVTFDIKKKDACNQDLKSYCYYIYYYNYYYYYYYYFRNYVLNII